MFQLGILGTSSAVPAFGRHPSAHIINHYERHLLIDCGEATQFQLHRYRYRLRNLDAVFISHLHGDHVFGLPGLLTSMSIYGREAPLVLVGPPSIQRYVEHQLRLSATHLNYPIHYTEWQPGTDAGRVVYETSKLLVTLLPLQHRIPCMGYLFQEKPKRPRFLADQAERLGIPNTYYHLLKQGVAVDLPDGRHIAAEAVLGQPEPAFSYAYCSDTAPHPPLLPYIQQVSLLYHEATFMQNLAARAADTGHSTTLQAAQVAADAQAGALLIGHYSARYTDLEALLQEARTGFANTGLATEGLQLAIPHDTQFAHTP